MLPIVKQTNMVKKAKEMGIAIVGTHTGNGSSGAIGYWSRKIADAGLVGGGFLNESDNDGNVVIAINPEAMIGMQKFIEETTKMTRAIKQAKKLEGVEEVMVPGERGDKIRSKILDSGEIEIEDNLLNSLKSFVEGN